MTTPDEAKRLFNRLMLRSAYQSLFWHVLLTRKRETGFTLKALADKLNINKSYVSRSFSSPPNWQIDKLSDMADALNVDLIVQARDRLTGKVYSPAGSTVSHAETLTSQVERYSAGVAGATAASGTDSVGGKAYSVGGT